MENLTFSEALDLIKAGERLARSGWNGQDQWVAIMLPTGDSIQSNHACYSYRAFHLPKGAIREDGKFGLPQNPEQAPKLEPMLVLKNQQDTLVSWVPSQGDLFATDWKVI